MRVIAAFNDVAGDEDLDLGDAFWLADTPSNRKFAEAAWASKRYDRNSTVFRAPSHVAQPADIVELLDDIDLHHRTGERSSFQV